MRFKGRFFRLFFQQRYREIEESFSRPLRQQSRKLSAILQQNRRTHFGREHGFADCRSIDDFRRRVPVSDYNALQPMIERMLRGEGNILTADDPFFFLTTSGTSGPIKFIPLTRAFDRDMSIAQRYWIARVLQTEPEVLAGKPLVLVSTPVEGRTGAGIPYGSISGKYLLPRRRWEASMKHWLLLQSLAVPWQVFQVSDAFARIYITALLALSQDLGILAAVNPSSLIQLFQFIQENRDSLVTDIELGMLAPAVSGILAGGGMQVVLKLVGHRLAGSRKRAKKVANSLAKMPFALRDIWPSLTVVSCWLGGSLSFYIDYLKKFCAGLPLRDFGYRASEGFFAIPLENETPAGVLNVFSHFLEFSREGGAKNDTLLAHEVKTGERYNLIVTQSGGLYRYDMDDIVEVVGRYKNTPLVRFCHKGSGTMSLTGEKITETHAVQVMEQFCRQWRVAGIHFCLAQQKEIPPFYIFIIEEFPQLPEIEGQVALPLLLDHLLQEMNHEYAGKRLSGRLAPPRVWVVEPGSFGLFLRQFRPHYARISQFKFFPLLSDEAERDWFISRRMRALS